MKRLAEKPRNEGSATLAGGTISRRISLVASGLAFLILAVALAVSFFPEGSFAQGGPPPGGIIYYGEATVDGEPVPDGIEIVARVGDYESKPITVAEGRYASLSVASPDTSHAGQTISFFLGDVPADQTDIYQPHGIPVIKTGFDLTFPNLPEPTPTPAPSVVPTDTPPTPVVPSPVPTPTPTVAEPMVFISGLVFIQGVPQMPSDSILVARIDDRYQSEPAAVIATDGTYGGLVVDPGAGSFEGSEIRFFLNGVAARTTAVYQSGKLERTFDILFTEYPTPIPTQTPSPVSTPTPEPTQTPIPTPTPAPTNTAIPPTSTPAPTNTPVPTPTPAPTNTAIPPTNTPVPTPEPTEPAQPEPPPTPTASPEESGGCFAVANVSPLTGAANALLLVAPLGLIVGLRRARSRQR